MTGKHSYEHVEVLKEDAGWEEDVTSFFVAFENSMVRSFIIHSCVQLTCLK